MKLFVSSILREKISFFSFFYYFCEKILYINKEEGKIEKLEIKDRTQNARIYILYNEIEINELSKE